MKLHKQEHIVIPGESTRGSCYPTVLACLLDLELHEVPYFHLFYWSEEEQDNIRRVMTDKFCYDENYNRITYEVAEDYQKDNLNRHFSMALNHWDNTLFFWLASRGLKRTHVNEEWIKNNPDKYYTASGLSSRGVSHIVIMKGGKLFHDPHPSNEGLVKYDEYTRYEILEKVL